MSKSKKILICCWAALLAGQVSAKTINWTHDGEGITHFNINGNSPTDIQAKLLGTTDAYARTFEVQLSEDCQPVFVTVYACNDESCSNPSATKSYKISCPIPIAPILESN